MELYKYIHTILSPGGVFVLLDMIKPQTKAGANLTAISWDEAVKKNAIKYDNNLEVFKKFQDLKWNYYSDPKPDPGDKPSGIFEQLKWLDEIGYDDVDVYWMNAGHALLAGFKF